MLVEAAWAAAKAPGPLHAFFVRIRAKRGHQIAAVALAHKLAVLCWHLLTKDVDYLWARPALVANKVGPWNCRPDRNRRKVIGVDRPTPTMSRNYETKKWKSPAAPKSFMSTSSKGGSPRHRETWCADASNRPGSNDGGPAELAAEALLFATRLPAQDGK